MEKSKFQELVKPHLRILRNKAYALTKDSDMADDLVQETLAKAYRYWDNFFDGSYPKGWLITMMVRLDINRKRLLENRIPIISMEKDIDEGNSILLFDSCNKETPEVVLNNKILRTQLVEAFKKIPIKYRRITYLRLIKGISYEDLAMALKIKVGTVKSKIHRGKIYLREELRQVAIQKGVKSENLYGLNNRERIRLIRKR